MVIKHNKWIPWECASTWPMHQKEETPDTPKCEGHMVLVDVKVAGGQPVLTKIWACNKCGFAFEE